MPRPRTAFRLRARLTSLLTSLVVVVAAPTVAATEHHGAGGPGPTADGAGSRAVDGATPRYLRPVGGAVVVPFQAPDSPYGPGHRGVDLAAATGTTVRAAGAGTVVFAGQVAGRRWVSIEHRDGVRTTYGPLASAAVAAGGTVDAGAVIGATAGPAHAGESPALHWGARRGDTYLDPLTLLGGRWRPTLVGSGHWSLVPRTDLPGYAPWDGEHRLGFVPGSPAAAGPGWSLPPNPNHVVGIAGLGTRTGEPPFDLTHLGYAAGDVSDASYAGTDRDGHPRPYGPQDTWRGVAAAARHLEEHLRAQWRREPGQAVDLVGHSMGGVVALYYLLHHHDPGDPGLPPIGHVVTVASPLEGADLASGVQAAREDPVLAAVLVAARDLVDDHDPWAPAIDDLALDSQVLAGMRARWDAARTSGSGGPLALGTRVLTTGGELDLVVPVHRSDLPGAEHVVLPGAHDGVRQTEAVRQVVRAFLADAPVPGETGGVGWWVSHPIGWVERLVPSLLAS